MKKQSNIIVQSSNNGISRVILNEPSTYNALSLNTLKSLIECFENFSNDEKTKVIIIEGRGKGFSAGHNLKEINLLKGKPDYKNLFILCSKLMMTIVNNNKPVIAKVHGAAFAAGCQLVASCDLAIASKDARFGTPGVTNGLFCSTPAVSVGRAVSRKHAMEMLLTGELFSAEDAYRFGLVNKVVPANQLDKTVLGYAESIASRSTLTMSMGKGAFYRQLDMPLEDAYSYASDVMARNMMEHDAQEGIDAFLQKRQPDWKGR